MKNNIIVQGSMAKSSFWLCLIRWLFVVTLGLCTLLVKAETYRYQYISFDQAKFPPGFNGSKSFLPVAIIDNGRVYGTALDNAYNPHVAVYNRGVVVILSPGAAAVANEVGTVGGSALTDPVNYIYQAALFRGHQTKLIPPTLPGEVNSDVLDINNDGTALVISYDMYYNNTITLYKKGQFTVLDFVLTADMNAYPIHINNEGEVSGTTVSSAGIRGFRHDPNTGKTVMLNPLPTDVVSWSMDINNRGNVLGYSSNVGGSQRIGLWDKKGIFHTYIVEGTPELWAWSHDLLFNDKNLIVTSSVSGSDLEMGNSYLVPKPGVRLNVSDLVVNPPSLSWKPAYIIDINNEGDIIGYDYDYSIPFLLKRINAKAPISVASTVPAAALASSVMASKRLAVPPQAAAFRRSQMHRLMSKSGFRLNAVRR